MDEVRFNAIARALAAGSSARRGLLRAAGVRILGATLFQPGLGNAVRTAAARCAGTHEACKRDGQCCSGKCRGRRGKKTCRRAPAQRTCTVDRDSCRVGDAGLGCNGSDACACAVTTSGTAFCGDIFADVCANCASEADCVALGFPPGSACIRVGGLCEDCLAQGGTKCVLPC